MIDGAAVVFFVVAVVFLRMILSPSRRPPVISVCVSFCVPMVIGIRVSVASDDTITVFALPAVLLVEEA